jgi:hypothetical protein
MEEQEYKNKDLIQPKEAFEKSVSNDIIGDDFADQLEWSMMILQDNFNQIKFGNHLAPIKRGHFDKAYLMHDDFHDNLQFLAPMVKGLQASPEIFPNLNMRTLNIGETITLRRFREYTPQKKRGLDCKKHKHVIEHSYAFYKKDTEAFYGGREGYAINPSFFKMGDNNQDKKINIKALPKLISLHPNYSIPENAFLMRDPEMIAEFIGSLLMNYQVAMSMYYEWSIYIKEYDNIGLIIPINPSLLSEIYKTSIMKFDSKKKMVHFVKDHYRRKVAKEGEDYSVYVNRYLRGENKFDYKGFYAEIIPPQYDLNRAKTRKKFINPLN